MTRSRSSLAAVLLAALAFSLIAVSSVAGTASAATHGAGTADASLERSLLGELNRVRAAHGLRPLAASPGLDRAARAHATSMATRGFFAHDSADGTGFGRRLARYFPRGRARTYALGENIRFQPQTMGAAEAVAAWMASPGHRANILARDYRVVGVAAVHVTAAPGVFGGFDVTILVTDFGARS